MAHMSLGSLGDRQFGKPRCLAQVLPINVSYTAPEREARYDHPLSCLIPALRKFPAKIEQRCFHSSSSRIEKPTKPSTIVVYV